MLNREISEALFERAQKVIPGGVNSPVRAFKSVGLDPIFIKRGKGSKIYDEDGNEYVDMICSWGPLILGHANDEVLHGVSEVLQNGTSYGVPTKLEIEMAEMINDAYPPAELIRMVNSGTEATMSALRVARGFTGRNKILKFEGCYHGHSDALLVKSGSGTLTYGVPTSPGVPADTVKDTIVCEYNNLASVVEAFNNNKGEISCIILEPIAGNMGVVPATAEFIKGLRELCDLEGALLIFDEVITGFRLAYGGAYEVFGVAPDLVCFGKIIGGGLPVGAYGGRKEVMSVVSPLGSVYQAGTLSGNPLAMKMGLNTLSLLKGTNVYEVLEKKAIYIEKRLNEMIEKNCYPLTVTRFKGMLCLFFKTGEFKSFEDVKDADTAKYAQFFKVMLEKGVLLPPAQFEGWFLSTAHSDEDVDFVIEKVRESLKEIFR